MDKTTYFLDTEFIEDGKTIDLISIGIVSKEGRQYYACNDECDLSRANDWVKANVLPLLPSKHIGVNPGNPDVSPGVRQDILTWKMKDEIAKDILKFCDPSKYGRPEFWANYAAYDWVVFCQLFGRMIDLPDGYPMYCKDIQQLSDDLDRPDDLPAQTSGQHNALEDALHNRELFIALSELKIIKQVLAITDSLPSQE